MYLKCPGAALAAWPCFDVNLDEMIPNQRPHLVVAGLTVLRAFYARLFFRPPPSVT
jgi:hypothetical protein